MSVEEHLPSAAGPKNISCRFSGSSFHNESNKPILYFETANCVSGAASGTIDAAASAIGATAIAALSVSKDRLVMLISLGLIAK
jgi:hypothetical protein